MKKVMIFLGCCLALIAGAQVIQWYSQQPATTTLADTDYLVIERPAPHAYNSFTLALLKSYLSDTGPNIATFSNTSPTNEVGSTVAAVTLNWTLSGSTPTSQSINQGIGAIPVGTLTANYGTPMTVDKTFTLSVANALGSDTATTTVRFMLKAYWGASSRPFMDDASIISSLSSEFGSARARTKTVTCSGQYMYFCYPASWGAALFTVNGLLNTAWQLTLGDFTNPSGHTESYRIYRSDNLLTGTYIVQIQ